MPSMPRPRSPAGPVTFHYFNDGPDLHHVQLIRLTDGKTVADLLQALKTPGPLPGWATEAGGPNVVDPGHELTATIDVAPGDYAIVCFVDTPDHVPHLMKGMAQALKVVAPPAGTAPAPAGPADLTIKLSNFKFERLRLAHWRGRRPSMSWSLLASRTNWPSSGCFPARPWTTS